MRRDAEYTKTMRVSVGCKKEHSGRKGQQACSAKYFAKRNKPPRKDLKERERTHRTPSLLTRSNISSPSLPVTFSTHILCHLHILIERGIINNERPVLNKEVENEGTS